MLSMLNMTMYVIKKKRVDQEYDYYLSFGIKSPS